MTHSVTSARLFAHLLWLLVHQAGDVDEQKAALRALMTELRDGVVSLKVLDHELMADGKSVSLLDADMRELRARLVSRQMVGVEFGAGARAADVLGAARALAGTSDDLSTVFVSDTVRFVRASDFQRSDESLLIMDSVFEGAPPRAEQPARQRAPERRVMEPPPLRDEPSVLASSEPFSEHGGLFRHFSAARTVLDNVDTQLERLNASNRANTIVRILDELAELALEAGRQGKHGIGTRIFRQIVRREREVQDIEAKPAFALTIRRLARGPLLRAIAQDLVRTPADRADHLSVLARTGEDGADALIEELVTSTNRSERRIYFDALVELKAGVPTLVHMLGDPRWFVARNAAALLGELRAKDAEQALTDQTHHDDERVRHAATIALMRLGTPRSLPAIELALRDIAPQIRIHAATALAEMHPVRADHRLFRALEEELDDEVKEAILLALGRLATPDAMSHLIATAQPDRSLFRRKPVTLRIAAIQALGEARVPEAHAALRTLKDDKDAEVRQAVMTALTKAHQPAS